MIVAPRCISPRLAFSAAGFIATRTSGASPGVRMSREAKWIWNAETPATVPAGARISAGKSGRVARSLPNTAVASVNRLPASCIPSPESPAMRTTTRSRVSLAFTVWVYPVSRRRANGQGVDETPHLVACPIVRRIDNPMSAVQLRDAFRRRELSPVELIDQVETTGPELGAFITYTLDTAREQAAAAEREYARGEPRPLSGL